MGAHAALPRSRRFSVESLLLTTAVADPSHCCPPSPDTPHYSILADVPYRIMHLYGPQADDGTVKYVVILREPAARTISSWQFKYDCECVRWVPLLVALDSRPP